MRWVMLASVMDTRRREIGSPRVAPACPERPPHVRSIFMQGELRSRDSRID